MFDKIILSLIIPFYALWKYLLNKKNPVNKKTFQMFLLKVNAVCLYLFLSLIYIEIDIFWVKIFLSFLILACLITLESNLVRISIYTAAKNAWVNNKIIQYTTKIISIFVIFWCIVFVEHELAMILLFAANLSDLMLLVGFEFPDDPPREKKVSKKWLEDIMSPTPQGSY